MDQLRHGFIDQRPQPLDRFDRTRPIVLRLVNANQGAHRRYRKLSILDRLERLFGPVQHTRLEKVLRQFVLGGFAVGLRKIGARRSEEHTSELQSLMRISYAVFCLKKKKKN